MNRPAKLERRVHHRESRRGITLVEMLTAMLVGSILSGLAVVAVVVAMRSANQYHEHLTATRSLDRLAGQFRSDAHAATQDVEPIADALLALDCGDTRVVYTRGETGLERHELRDGVLLRRETFPLPSYCSIQVDTSRRHGRQFLRLCVLRSSDDEIPVGSRVRPLVVKAMCGRDWRFVELGENVHEIEP